MKTGQQAECGAPQTGDFSTVSPADRQTLRTILGHALTYHLTWTDTLTLLATLGSVGHGGGNAYVFEIGPERYFMRKPDTRTLTAPELMALRHFIRRAGWRYPSCVTGG